MPDAEHVRDQVRSGAAPIAPRPEGEPHLTFGTLLADTLYEMAAHESDTPVDPDAVTVLCDDAVAALRAAGDAPLVRPFHHAYLTPAAVPALPSRPTRLDIRY